MVLIIALAFAGAAHADPLAGNADCQIATFPNTMPTWGKEQITASRMMDADYIATTAPLWDADPMNITVVVETGDHKVSVLNGDSFEVLDRFAAPIGVRGDLSFSPDGRYAFILSCDGWVQKYDIWSLAPVGRVRAGLKAQSMAISADGKWLAVANDLPNTLSILSTGDLSVGTLYEVTGDETPSLVSGVHTNPTRESFVLALKDVPAIWEVFYGPNPPTISFTHDWRIEGPVAQTNPFPIRKITRAGILGDFGFDSSYEYIIGATGPGDGVMVVDLVIGQKVAELDLSGTPQFSQGAIWNHRGTTVIATTHLNESIVSVIDMSNWKVVARIPTHGAGLAVRSHENSGYLWADTFFGRNRDMVHVIDKHTLEIVTTLRPVPGATIAQVEFTRDGRQALVLVWGDDSAVIVYDTETLEELTRLPMSNPSGAYNVWNRITSREGSGG
ncbi:MAG: cytochrome C oxidase Cbb3 [Rhodobacteraceae bacterium]|nr:cytochrome C oxidase Cbb3 [Paracoccaceae bacterium]